MVDQRHLLVALEGLLKQVEQQIEDLRQKGALTPAEQAILRAAENLAKQLEARIDEIGEEIDKECDEL
ncbi:hypothetical protein ACIA8G_21340 [Lentzea sp. NPDC051213]|uniref:hypothetical protein n=1 Tax=Lentzea sp. NPDC051213 TaxID=3364126 RepID=UPI003797939A